MINFCSFLNQLIIITLIHPYQHINTFNTSIYIYIVLVLKSMKVTTRIGNSKLSTSYSSPAILFAYIFMYLFYFLKKSTFKRPRCWEHRGDIMFQYSRLPWGHIWIISRSSVTFDSLPTEGFRDTSRFTSSKIEK